MGFITSGMVADRCSATVRCLLSLGHSGPAVLLAESMASAAPKAAEPRAQLSPDALGDFNRLLLLLRGLSIARIHSGTDNTQQELSCIIRARDQSPGARPFGPQS